MKWWKMSRELRGTHLPLGIVFVTTMLMLAEFFIVSKPVSDASVAIREWSLILSGFAAVVGYVMLFRHHLVETMKKRRSSFYNAVVIVTSVVYCAAGLVLGVDSPMYAAMYSASAAVVTQTMWAIMALFLMAGIYRAFVARNIDATMFLVPAVLMMLYYAPVGPAVWSGFPVIGAWLTTNIQGTSSRALVITATAGAIIIALRTLLGEESGFLKRVAG